MRMSIGKILRAATFSAALAIMSSAPAYAQADNYPSGPLRLIVGFAAGGGTDVFVRLLAPYLSEAIGKPVLVENRVGANGNLANEFVAKSAPDGLTLLVATSSVMGSGPYASASQAVHPVKDLAHVTMIVESPYYFVANPGNEHDTLAALLDAAKKKPGTIVYGGQGVGGIGEVFAKLLEVKTGAVFNLVQYTGGGAVVNDMLANQAHISNFSSSMMNSYYPTRQVKALAVISKDRNPVTPDIPSMNELGIEGFDKLTYWAGLHVHKDTPPEIIQKIYEATKKAFENKELRERVVATGQAPVVSTPEDFNKRVLEDYEYYGEIFRIAKIKVQ